MPTYSKTKSKAGSRVDGLWTAKSGHAEKPGLGLVSLNPRLRYVEKQQKKDNRNEPVAAKPARRWVTLDPWGMHTTRKKKRRKTIQEGEDLLAANPERASITGDPAGTIEQEERGSSRSDRWAREPARGR